jgi:hypothetical protein
VAAIQLGDREQVQRCDEEAGPAGERGGAQEDVVPLGDGTEDDPLDQQVK